MSCTATFIKPTLPHRTGLHNAIHSTGTTADRGHGIVRARNDYEHFVLELRRGRESSRARLIACTVRTETRLGILPSHTREMVSSRDVACNASTCQVNSSFT